MAERSVSQEEKYQNIRKLFHENQLPATVNYIASHFDEEQKPFLVLRVKEELTEQDEKRLAELDSKDLPLKIELKGNIFALKKPEQNIPS